MPSDGPAGRSIADLAADLDLGRGDPGVAWADDPIDGCEARVGQPVGERADRLGTTGDDEGVDVEQPGRPEQDRVAWADASAGEATTTRPTPATCAGTTVMTSDDG